MIKANFFITIYLVLWTWYFGFFSFFLNNKYHDVIEKEAEDEQEKVKVKVEYCSEQILILSIIYVVLHICMLDAIAHSQLYVRCYCSFTTVC